MSLATWHDSKMRDAATPTDWADFARTLWERAAVSCDGEYQDIPHRLTPSVFRALVSAAERSAAGDANVKFCFWIDGNKQEEFAAYLPNAADGTFEAYDARVRRELQGREYTILLAEPHSYDEGVWTCCNDVVRRFARHTGLPNGWLDTAVFAGSYRMTPFGVHQGPMSVFTVPLVGQKSFRLWSSDYVSKNKQIINSSQYSEHLAASYVLSAAPNGYIYWPSREWHVAESDGCFTAALSIGIWCNEQDLHPLWAVMKLMEKVLATMPKPLIPPCDKPLAQDGIVAPTLPASIEHYVQGLEEFVSSKRLRHEALGWLVQQYSCTGFKCPPISVRTAQVGADDWFTRNAATSIVASCSPIGELCVGVNGHAFSITDGPVVRRFVQALAHHRGTFTPRGLLSEAHQESMCGELDITGATAILEQVLAAKGITRI